LKSPKTNERSKIMGKVIRVTPEEIEKAAAQISELSKTYTEIYTHLLQQAQTMGEAWEGADNVAFVEQISGFCEELKAMSDRLQSASDTLIKQKTNYATRQENNITGVRKLTN